MKRVALIVLAVVLVLLAAYAALSLSQRRQLDLADAAARELALDLGRVIATAIADDVSRNEWATLDAQLAAMVRGRRLVAVVVLDPSGRVLATTDRRWAGQVLADPEWDAVRNAQQLTIGDGAALVHVLAPVTVGTQRLAAVRLTVDLRRESIAGSAGR